MPHDVLIEVLRTMDKELERLHYSLSNDTRADDDVTQGQISSIVDELCRLSESLGDVVVENANS